MPNHKPLKEKDLSRLADMAEGVELTDLGLTDEGKEKPFPKLSFPKEMFPKEVKPGERFIMVSLVEVGDVSSETIGADFQEASVIDLPKAEEKPEKEEDEKEDEGEEEGAMPRSGKFSKAMMGER